MQTLLSKVAAEMGCIRRINVSLFGDLPVPEGAPEGTKPHSGAAFVLAETSPEAVAEYAMLRQHGKTPLQAFAQAFVNYFAADHDVIDLQAAAANYDGVVRDASFNDVQQRSKLDETLFTYADPADPKQSLTISGSAAYAMTEAEKYSAAARAAQAAS